MAPVAAPAPLHRARPEPAIASPAAARPTLIITDTERLTRLAAPLALHRLVFGVSDRHTVAMRASARYRSFRDSLFFGAPDEASDADRRRLQWLPQRWIMHPRTFYVLVGVVNRLDQRDLGQTTCGETRLVYRLAYADGDGAEQRLPVALNVIFAQPEDDPSCRTVARRWIVPSGQDVIETLTREGGPLHPERLSLSRLVAIETNMRVAEESDDGRAANELQVLRYDPREDRFHATGLAMQTFWKTRVTLPRNRAPLQDPAWLAAVERGTAHADNGQTWANFSVEGTGPLLEPSHFTIGSMVDYSSLYSRFLEDTKLPDDGIISTWPAFEHRIDTLGCAGCHRQRSLGGFHLPGAGSATGLVEGTSPHSSSELAWREAYVQAVADGEEPRRQRKFNNDGPPGFGRHCSLRASPVQDLRCDDGFACREVVGFAFGMCLPIHDDGARPCDGTEPDCRPPSAWFPGGFLARSCGSEQSCARVITPADYGACRQDPDPWQCSRLRAALVAVDACDAPSDCRDGYACVRDTGCVPVASLPEFRIAGHRQRLH